MTDKERDKESGGGRGKREGWRERERETGRGTEGDVAEFSAASGGLVCLQCHNVTVFQNAHGKNYYGKYARIFRMKIVMENIFSSDNVAFVSACRGRLRVEIYCQVIMLHLYQAC